MDRTRTVLVGDETRACWQALPDEPEPGQGLFRDLVAPPTPTGLVPIIRSSAPVRGVIAVHHEKPRGLATQAGTDERTVGDASRLPGRPIPAAAPEARAGRLIEAPVVPPSRRITSAAEQQVRAQMLGIPAGPAASPAASPPAGPVMSPAGSVEGQGLEEGELQPAR